MLWAGQIFAPAAFISSAVVAINSTAAMALKGYLITYLIKLELTAGLNHVLWIKVISSIP